MKYKVWVYEPLVDPGGYQEILMIEATSTEEACVKALRLGNIEWPGNKGLSIWTCTEERTDENL